MHFDAKKAIDFTLQYCAVLCVLYQQILVNIKYYE